MCHAHVSLTLCCKLETSNRFRACQDLQESLNQQESKSKASCLLLTACSLAEWRQQTEDQKQRTEQLILDTSAREAELLLKNSELTQEVIMLRLTPLDTAKLVTLLPGHMFNDHFA